MNFVRWPFFVVNSLFMIFGIGIISVGILLLTNYSIVEDMLVAKSEISSNYSESVYRSDVPILLKQSAAPMWLSRIRDPASYLLITFGALYFTMSFIGCCASVKDSRGLMILYAVFMIVVFIVEVTGVSLYEKYKPDLKAEVANAINQQYNPEEMQKFTQFEFILDLLMIKFKCCGVNDEKDFKGAYSNIYSFRSLSIDPRSWEKAKVSAVTPDDPYADEEDEDDDGNKDVEIEAAGEHEIHDDNDDVARAKPKARGMGLVESRVITGPEVPSERQVPVSCCKLNLTNVEASKMLRNIYRRQEDKLQLLNYAIDETCVTKPDETNAYVGESHGCFDKIQGETSTPLWIGIIIVGLIQACGLVFSGFILKSAYFGRIK